MNRIEPKPRGRRPARAAGMIVPATALGLPSGADAEPMATAKVAAPDYAHQAAATLPAGPTTFTLDHQGKVRHEVAIGRVLADLTPGRTYALFCNLQDAPDTPRHYTMGMFATVQVK